MKELFLKDFAELCKKYHITSYCRIENKNMLTADNSYYLSWVELQNGAKIYANDMINALKEK